MNYLLDAGLQGLEAATKNYPKPVAVEREAHAPFSEYVEEECENCGGNGADPGCLHAHEFEPCSVCNGNRTVTVFRDWLGEAFRIARGPRNGELIIQPRKEHIVALTTYARQTVNALFALPEVA
jgi:hypothetical protein